MFGLVLMAVFGQIGDLESYTVLHGRGGRYIVEWSVTP